MSAFLAIFPTIVSEMTKGANIFLYFFHGHEILSLNISFNGARDKTRYGKI